jgi:hypothetical protein
MGNNSLLGAVLVMLLSAAFCSAGLNNLILNPSFEDESCPGAEGCDYISSWSNNYELYEGSFCYVDSTTSYEFGRDTTGPSDAACQVGESSPCSYQFAELAVGYCGMAQTIPDIVTDHKYLLTGFYAPVTSEEVYEDPPYVAGLEIALGSQAILALEPPTGVTCFYKAFIACDTEQNILTLTPVSQTNQDYSIVGVDALRLIDCGNDCAPYIATLGGCTTSSVANTVGCLANPANLIKNPSFDEDDCPMGFCSTITHWTNNAGSGLMLLDNSQVITSFGGDSPPVSAPDNFCHFNMLQEEGCNYQFLEIDSTYAKAAQIIESISAGQQYLLSGYYASGLTDVREQQYSPAPLLVTLDGATLVQFGPAPPGTWQCFYKVFTASSSAPELMFQGSVVDDSSALMLDGLALVDCFGDCALALAALKNKGPCTTDRAPSVVAHALANYIQGHYSQKFILPLAPQKCINLYSTADLQLSVSADFLAEGMSNEERKAARRLNRRLPSTQRFVRAGYYSTAATVRLGGINNVAEIILTVKAGQYGAGFSLATLKIKDVAAPVDLFSAGNSLHQLSSLSSQTLSVELLDPYRIKVISQYFSFLIENSDNFLNIERAGAVDFNAALDNLSGINGALGRTMEAAFPASSIPPNTLINGENLLEAWRNYVFDAVEGQCEGGWGNCFAADVYFAQSVQVVISQVDI